MKEEEIDFDQAKPLKLAAEVSPEKTAAFFKGEEQTKLQPREITEELLARLYDNMQEAEMLAKLIEQARQMRAVQDAHHAVESGQSAL